MGLRGTLQREPQGVHPGLQQAGVRQGGGLAQDLTVVSAMLPVSKGSSVNTPE